MYPSILSFETINKLKLSFECGIPRPQNVGHPRFRLFLTCQQPMQTEGAWRVRLYLKGRPLSAAMIVTNDVAQSIIGMNIIGPRCLVMDPVTCTVDFRDKGAAAALGVLGQREDGSIADVRVLRATTIPGRHGQLLKLGLFNSERHRNEYCASTHWRS
jgi:hypothetical protein